MLESCPSGAVQQEMGHLGAGSAQTWESSAHTCWLKQRSEERAIHGPRQTSTVKGGHRERRVATKETEGTIREMGGELKGRLEKEFMRSFKCSK